MAIALECTVRRKPGVTEFEIRWFRENTTGAVEDLGLGADPNINAGLSNMDQTSRLYETALFYSPSLLGKYWCQVIKTGVYPYQPLMRSNVFTLLAPENYNHGPTCSTAGVQQVMNMTCADLPPQPPSVATTVHIQIVSGYVMCNHACTHGSFMISINSWFLKYSLTLTNDCIHQDLTQLNQCILQLYYPDFSHSQPII